MLDYHILPTQGIFREDFLGYAESPRLCTLTNLIKGNLLLGLLSPYSNTHNAVFCTSEIDSSKVKKKKISFLALLIYPLSTTLVMP